MVLHQCIYKSNYILSLFNYCLHTSPHATTISCDPVSFQEPLAFPPPPSSICMPVNRLQRVKQVRREERKEERAGLCTHRITPKFVCAAARLLLFS